ETAHALRAPRLPPVRRRPGRARPDRPSVRARGHRAGRRAAQALPRADPRRGARRGGALRLLRRRGGTEGAATV
ncbi:MAG: hypothetical protein AVDCRST_MAG85-1773, partial [uncultured Solirubrobacteraceae bacterium]